MIEDYLRFRWVTQEADKDATQDNDNDCFSGLVDDEQADDELITDSEPCECPDYGNIDLTHYDECEDLCSKQECQINETLCNI